eukprot:2538174-Alexandrium_andersonii.AAC.1
MFSARFPPESSNFPRGFTGGRRPPEPPKTRLRRAPCALLGRVRESGSLPRPGSRAENRRGPQEIARWR